MTVYLTALVLFGAVVLGGGTRTGFLGDVIVQSIAVPLLVVSVLNLVVQRSSRHQFSPGAAPSVTHAQHNDQRRERASWFVLLAVAGLALWQFLPLPLWLIGSLAQRVPIDESETLAAAAAPWRSIAVAPHAAWSGLVALIVPVAVFLGVAQMGERTRVRLARGLIAAGAVSLMLGLLQVAQGPESELRFFAVTNPSEAVGFFANRNHFAALMYVTLVLAATWLIDRSSTAGRQLFSGHNLVLLAGAFGLTVAVVSGLAMARSRAGILLTMVAVVGLVVLIRASARPVQGENSPRNTKATRIVIATLGFALLFALQFGLHRIMTRIGADPLEDLRIPLTLTTLEAAVRSFPFGTGIGSFVPVFAVFERPTELLASYANRAHNDFAEWLLETGAVGLVLMTTALVWLARASWRVWRGRDHASDHVILQRAATLIVLLLLAHSLVDYPLRTTAVMAVFAFAAAVLLPAKHQLAHETSAGPAAPLERREMHKGGEAAAPPIQRPVRPRESWGADVRWPDAWRPTRPDNTEDEES